MRTKSKEIREKIIEYLFESTRNKGNGKITEEKIASYFKVSRTPVREVLKLLEEEGIISTKRNRGIRVKKLTKEEVRQVYEIRTVIEEFAARNAAKNIKQKEMRQLEEYARKCDEERKKGDIISARRYDRLFHEKIVEISGNWYLKFIEKKLGIFSLFFALSRARAEDRIDPTPYPHKAIINALSTKNPDIASEMIRNHIQWIADYTIKNWSEK